MSAQEQIIIKTYKGSQAEATKAFQADSVNMVNQDYYPTSQTWAPGTYGCGAFLLALLLCAILIGILVFIYMLIVKPAGTLTVTYELRLPSKSPKKQIADEEKVCPSCAEKIKLKAIKCRFCGQEFDATEVEKQVAKLSNNVSTRVACDDGNCIGILGPDGKCIRCGKPITGNQT